MQEKHERYIVNAVNVVNDKRSNEKTVGALYKH